MTGTIKRVTVNYSMRIPYFDTPNWGIELERNFDIIDSVMFAITGLANIKGAWTNSTQYIVGDRVVADGRLWVCLVQHVSRATGDFQDDLDAHPTYWEQANAIVNNRGEWATATNYSVNDFVYDGGNRWGVVTQNYVSGNSFSDDVADGKILVLMDLTVTFATQAEAEGGVDETKFMNPLRTRQSFLAMLATEAEAEAGADNTKYLSSLRTKQAIIEYGNNNFAAKNRGLPSGGATDQVLVKLTGTNYDAGWADPTALLPDNTLLIVASPSELRGLNVGDDILFIAVGNSSSYGSIYTYTSNTSLMATSDDVIVSRNGRRFVRSVAGQIPGPLGRNIHAANTLLDVNTLLGKNNRRIDYPTAGVYSIDPSAHSDGCYHYVYANNGTVKIDVAGLLPYRLYTIYTSRTGVLQLDCGPTRAFNGSLAPSEATQPTVIDIAPNHCVTLCRIGGATIHVTVDALDGAWVISGASKFRRQSNGLYEFIHTRAASAISAAAVTTAGCTITTGYDLTSAVVLSCTVQPLTDGTIPATPGPVVCKLGTTHSLAANAFGIGNPSTSVQSGVIVTHFSGVAKL